MGNTSSTDRPSQSVEKNGDSRQREADDCQDNGDGGGREKLADTEPEEKPREELERVPVLNLATAEHKVGRKSKSEDEEIDEDDDDEIMIAVQSGTSLAESRTAFKKSLPGPQVSFKLLLNCEHDKTVEEKELEVEGNLVPLPVVKLKLCIEHSFSIPACCQTIKFEYATLEDQCLLSSYRIRDGDCLRVTFKTKANVTEIMRIIDRMKKTYVFIRSLRHDLNNGNLSDDTLYLIDRTICSDDVESLPEVYFSYTMDKAESNRVFFVHCGGVKLFHKLHTELLRFPWSNLPLRMQYLELSILRCYWNITAAFSVRMFVLHNSKALQNIVKSFLRIKLQAGSQVKAPRSAYANRIGYSRMECDRNAISVGFKAMGALCK